MGASSTDRKALAAIYREAARRMEADEYCKRGHVYGYACNAIADIDGVKPGHLRRVTANEIAFKTVFNPGRPETRHGFFGVMEKMANRNRRVLALCFMAALVEAGDVGELGGGEETAFAWNG